MPVDTSKGEQHLPAFRKINPNGKVPAIVDTDGPGGKEARVFDSTAILLYLADKTGKFLGSPEDRPELLSWLFFIASGLGPFSGQAVHFQFAAPDGLDYAVNRYRREAERHYQVLERSSRRPRVHRRRHVTRSPTCRLGLDRSRVARAARAQTTRSPPIRISSGWFRPIDGAAGRRAGAGGRDADHAFKKERRRAGASGRCSRRTIPPAA